jgi:single-stranded-DNA-specific exonuclease
MCAQLLLGRGLSDPAAADAFLSRRFDLLHDPLLLPDMPRAIARLAQAVEKGEKILLFGDYDADGITATALLTRFFDVLRRQLHSKVQVESRISDRKHGYGLTPPAVERILARRPDVLVTLDNGISAHTALNALAEAGIDCIVVDHHHVQNSIPRAVAVVNPKRPDSTYPYSELCGAGIAFKLAWALAMHFSQNKRVTPEFRAFLLDAVALAGTGTLADIVPLTGENRILAHQGLLALNRSQSPGWRALIRIACPRSAAASVSARRPSSESSRKDAPIRASDVSFGIAPRLNAASRCGDASDALELLTSDDPARAEQLAAALDRYNVQRQELQGAVVDSVRESAAAALASTPACAAFVLASSEWHQGVIGIAASRIVDEFHRPTLLLSIDAGTGIARGSGRSIPGLHLTDALARQKDYLLNFGGHAAAAGFSIEAARIGEFRGAFQADCAQHLEPEDFEPVMELEARMKLGEIDARCCADLEKLEPFGMGNPAPMLAVCGVSVKSPPKLLGKTEEHVSFYASDGNTARRVVGWNHAPNFNALCDLTQSGPIDVAFRPQLNNYRGETSVELVMEAFRKSPEV